MYRPGLPYFIIPYVLGTGLVIGSILSVPHQEQCDLSSVYHVHLYTREIGNTTIKKWLHNEKDTFYYQKEDALLPITNFDLKIFETLNDYKLFEGKENLDFVHYQIEKNRDYMEFYYFYTQIRAVKTGKTTTLVTDTYQGWSSNPCHRGVTGKVRVYHRRYYAYKLVQSENGLELEKSKDVDDVRTILNEYPYMNEDTNHEVSEDFDFLPMELPYLKLEDFNPFYTPTVNDNPLDSSDVSKTKNYIK